jgi:hypothetical protein
VKRAAVTVGIVLAGAGVAAAVRRPGRDGDPVDTSGMPTGMDPPSRRTPLGDAPQARVLPVGREPASLAALARWEPAAPRSVLAQVAAYVWAAPLSLLGVLVGLTTGSWPTVREGVLVFDDTGGLPEQVLRRFGFQAGALGHVVVARRLTPATFAHELVHVRQAERFGPVLAPLYLGLLAVYGYARHPLERAARIAGRRILDESRP